MFRNFAIGGGLFLFLVWAGPMLVQAARRMKEKSAELYDEAENEGNDDTPSAE